MLLLHTLFSCCVGGFCFSNVPRGFDARRMISGVFCALRIERGSWRLALNFQPLVFFFFLRVYCLLLLEEGLGLGLGLRGREREGRRV